MTRSILRGVGAAAILLFHSSFVASAQEGMRDFEPSAVEFINSCSSCHGDEGKGAGFLTRVFRGIDPGDLTQLAANNDGKFPFERVFEVIDGRAEVAAHGDRQMPVWGDRYWEDAMSDYGPDDLNQRRARTRVLEVTYFLQSIQE
ncbi:MAG TPA: cytochrome c [Roseovarius sp.]